MQGNSDEHLYWGLQSLFIYSRSWVKCEYPNKTNMVEDGGAKAWLVPSAAKIG